MQHKEQWIWLPKEIYPHEQVSPYGRFAPPVESRYTVAEFCREYTFSQEVVCARLRFSGDTAFQLFLNDDIVATGPASVGGDFIGNETARENFYAFETTVQPHTCALHFFARVQMGPVQICEYSKGHGGFMLSAWLTFADGSECVVGTDDSWMVRKNGGYTAPRIFDGRILPDAFLPAERVEDIWRVTTAPIPPRAEETLCVPAGTFALSGGEEATAVLEFDKIWGGFIAVQTAGAGEIHLSLTCREIAEETEPERVILCGEQHYRGFYLHSAGNIVVTAKNVAKQAARVTVLFVKTHYPVGEEAVTETSDPALNAVLQVCKHTLKICRQTHHLDSTRHCEPLACTGDYYIESLMTPFAFGDMRLAVFDLVRTAVMLERERGRMFHTTYSLIWVKMLCDVYMLTGDVALLQRCKAALDLLLVRFEAYVGENGLVETPPDYMFVDWMYIDGISMHHPPKALGQSCLNMFYCGALESAADVYRVLGDEGTAARCHTKREALRHAINTHLFDAEKGCYFEGLNTPTPPALLCDTMPPNVEKRYYLKHANILAAYFGVCSDAVGRELIGRIMNDDIPGDCQPYFMHYLLEAVYRHGLREQYTLPLCDRWKAAAAQCDKGLVEGFVPPEPTYCFDHSHAWGGTPLYALPKALLGLEITVAGMREITLSPSLLGLACARVELLTPFGKVVCRMQAGEEVQISHPEEVTVRFRDE